MAEEYESSGVRYQIVQYRQKIKDPEGKVIDEVISDTKVIMDPFVESSSSTRRFSSRYNSRHQNNSP